MLDVSTPGYYVAGIVDEMHPSPHPAKIGPFELVKLHIEPNLNHSVAILGVVPISFEMIVEMIFCGCPSLSRLLGFHKHELILVQGSAGPLRNLKDAEVGPGVHRHGLLDDRIPFTRGEDEAKDVSYRPPEDVFVRVRYPNQKVEGGLDVDFWVHYVLWYGPESFSSQYIDPYSSRAQYIMWL